MSIILKYFYILIIDKENNKKPFNDGKKKKDKIINQSATDPDSGVFHKRTQEMIFILHTGCDKNGYIMGVVVTAGNVHDSIGFNDLYDELTEHYDNIETVVTVQDIRYHRYVKE